MRGFTMGTFDRLHIGHLALLERARDRCQHLTAGVIDDNLVATRKGRRPFDSVHSRAAALVNNRSVDTVTKVYSTDLGQLWEQHRFDVLFIGDDWAGKVKEDPRWRTVVLTRTPNVSTTAIRGDVPAPIVSCLNYGALSICLVALAPICGLAFAIAVPIMYAAARHRFGRVRVHDWLYRNIEEDSTL